MEVGSRNKVKFAFRARNFQHRLKPVISYIRDLILWEQTLQPDILGLSVTAAAWVPHCQVFWTRLPLLGYYKNQHPALISNMGHILIFNLTNLIKLRTGIKCFLLVKSQKVLTEYKT